MKAIISILALVKAFVCVSAHELRGGPTDLSDVALTDADRESHGQMTKFVADFDVCDTFAVKLSDCLISKEGKTYEEAVQCFRCITDANDDYLQNGFICADLKETGYCDTIEFCKKRVCENKCSTEIDNWLSCHIVYAGCDEDNNYSSECLDGIK